MRYLTDVANWWDAQHKTAELSLDDFVERNPNRFAIILATGVNTSMVLGAGMVDVLRVGDGLMTGTLSGVAQDGLRLIGLLGPTGKTLQVLKSRANMKIAKVILDPGGEICSWVNSTKALALTGFRARGKMFVAVEDLAKAVGVPFHSLQGIRLSTMTNHLRQIGAKMGELKTVSNIRDVIQMLPRDGSVVLISVLVMRGANVAGGHAIHAFYDSFGRVRIMDRTGIYSDLAALAHRYRATELIPREAIKLENVYGKFVGPHGMATLAMEALGVVKSDQH
ncbi:MAG: hypothetical protein H7315_06485 [Herminiimonas sp.]|nr:hypothetical protein [Herminiimonas sp.]